MKNCLSDHYLQSISLVNTGTGEVLHNELETALAIAIKMKEEKFDIDKIAGLLSFSIEEIESL